jgi:organic hydroperoxide reductase OsmC/OhrA
MSTYTINLEWKQDSDDFSYEKYNRNHSISFSGNQTLKNSASPEYYGNTDMSNPEELLASALASCHMLTFLAIASKSGYNVQSYRCKAEAVLGKNDDGKMSVTEITLTPEIVYNGDKHPSDEQLKSLHEKSHKNCFIAQSLKTKVNVL